MTLTFTLVSALVLVALGLFLHARLRAELDHSLQAGLRQRLGDLTALAESGDTASLGHSSLVERGDDVAQVLDDGGRIIAAAPGFEAAPLITPAEQRRAKRQALSVRREALEDNEQIALLAAPAGPRIAIVGASLEDRDDALANLDALLLVGLPLALLLSALASYVVSGSALRPMERLRARAEEIGDRQLSQRLPVPSADDELRRLAETLNGMLARLEETLGRERAFVADASHELRTPLARLKAELDLAGREGRSVSELDAAVHSAAAETERLIRLAEDLLVLARSDQGKLPLRSEPLDVGDLLEETRRRYAPDARVEGGAGLVVVGDRIRLQQALANLVDNAGRHGDGEITLGATADADSVSLHVRDQGKGIPEDLQGRVFERFTRGDLTRDPDGGAGLGLAIVAAIAAAHGGSVGITAGARSDVWMKLPA